MESEHDIDLHDSHQLSAFRCTTSRRVGHTVGTVSRNCLTVSQRQELRFARIQAAVLVHSAVAEEMSDEADEEVQDSEKEGACDPENGGKWDKKKDRGGDVGSSRFSKPEARHEESRHHGKDDAPGGNVRSGDSLMHPAQDKEEEDEEGGKEVGAPEPPEFRHDPGPEGSHALILRPF